MATILCIDDEAFIREDVCEFLESVGHTVHQADGGESGLKAILKHQPDLVLCDFTMPNMNGGQLLVQLRENHPDFADMPFIFLSALADRNDVLEGIKLGADDYMTKPIDFDMLELKLEASLRQMSRMKAKKDQEFIKLFNALSGGDENATPAELVTLKPEVSKSVKLKKEQTKDEKTIFGTVFRFDDIKVVGDKANIKSKIDLPALFAEKSLKFLEKTLPETILISKTPGEGLLVCYMDADVAEVKKQSNILKEKLEKYLKVDYIDDLIRITTIPKNILSYFINISSNSFETTVSADELSNFEKFSIAIKEQIEIFYSHNTISSEIAKAIEDDGGFLIPLNLIREDDQLVPINFFDFDELTSKRLPSSLALLSRENFAIAKCHIDIMRLNLLKRDVRKYGGVSTLVVDINYETISTISSMHSYLAEFERFCSSISPKTKIILNIIGHSSDRPGWHIDKVITPFKQYITRYIMQVPPHLIEDHAQSEIPFMAIVCSYSDFIKAQLDEAVFLSAKEKLTKSGKLFILRSLPAPEELSKFRKLGFNGCAIPALQ